MFNQYALQSYKVQLSEPSQEKFAHYILTKHFENVLQVSEGIEAVHHRQRELASFWACQHHLRDKKVTFLLQTMRKKKDERKGDKWKGGRHSVSLNVVIEAALEYCQIIGSDCRGVWGACNFAPLPPSGPHTEAPYNYFKQPLMRGKKATFRFINIATILLFNDYWMSPQTRG